MSNAGRVIELVNLNAVGQRPMRVRVEPALPFSAQGFAAATSTAALEEGSARERQRLLATGQPPDGQRWEQEINKNTARLSACLCVALAIFAVTSVGLAIAAYTRADQLINSVSLAIGPNPQGTARGAVVNVVDILNYSSAITANLAKLTGRTDAILSESRPVVTQALNTSASLLTRLDTFAAHPTLSIGGGGFG